ncbi:hypothetical protein N8468_04295 [Planktomarina temperata]|nr:hypothetical protein [Planktomarina temperata]
MGGKPVRPDRDFTLEELGHIRETLEDKNVGERAKMIALILHQIGSGVEPKEIANNVVKAFIFANSRDPYNKTLATIYRIVKDDINRDGLTAAAIIGKRGAAKLELDKWPESRIINTLVELHNNHGAEFSYDILKKSYPGLLSVIERNANFSAYLTRAGINPEIHLKDFVWGSDLETKSKIQAMLLEISTRLGIEQLNYHSMYSRQSALIGTAPNSHSNYPKCREYGCIRRVTGGAIIRQAERLYSTWMAAVCDLLDLTEDQYENRIERKKHRVGFESYFDVFSDYIDNKGASWDIASFVKEQRSTYRGLHNHKDKLLFYEQCYGDVIVAAYCEYRFNSLGISEAEFSQVELNKAIKEAKQKRTTNLQVRQEGYFFQDFVKSVFEKHGLIEGEDFLYEKKINSKLCKSKSHSKECRVEFQFEDLLIDTKRSRTRNANEDDQIARYLDHCNKLIILTVRDNEGILERYKQGSVRVINFPSFVQSSKELIGFQIHESALAEFDEYCKDAQLRISAGENSD